MISINPIPLERMGVSNSFKGEYQALTRHMQYIEITFHYPRNQYYVCISTRYNHVKYFFCRCLPDVLDQVNEYLESVSNFRLILTPEQESSLMEYRGVKNAV